MTRRKQKTYKGNAPKGAGWMRIGQLADEKDGKWVLYANLLGRNDSGWVNLKLVALKRAPDKANYVLGWSTIERRLARNTSKADLEQGRPVLYERLLRVVETVLDAALAALDKQ